MLSFELRSRFAARKKELGIDLRRKIQDARLQREEILVFVFETRSTRNPRRKEWSLISFGVLSKDCYESNLSPQPILSPTVASSLMQLYSKLTKSLAVGAAVVAGGFQLITDY